MSARRASSVRLRLADSPSQGGPIAVWRTARRVLAGLAAVLGVTACGAPAADEGNALGQLGEAFVNGTDDRQEYFHLNEAGDRAALERFTVALMPEWVADLVVAGDMADLPTWGEL